MIAFFLFGVALVLPGVSQPAIAAALGLDLVETGLLASSLSLGLGIGVVAAGPVVDRLARRPLFAGAAVFAGAGLLLLPQWGGYGAVLAAVFVLGLGGGVFETVLNTVIPQRDPARASSRLALVHAFATAGAAVGAGLLGPGVASLGWEVVWLGLGCAYLLLGALGAAVPMPAPPAPTVAAVAPRLWPALFPLMLAAAAYVGVETALTVFLPPLVGEAGLDIARGSSSISAFWGGLLVSRLVVAAVVRRTDARWLIACGVSGAVLFALAPLLRPYPEAWSAAIGFAFGPVFPMLVALTGERFPQARGTATGLVVGAGSLGGVLLPFGVGVLGDHQGVLWAVTSLGLTALLVAFGGRR